MPAHQALAAGREGQGSRPDDGGGLGGTARSERVSVQPSLATASSTDRVHAEDREDEGEDDGGLLLVCTGTWDEQCGTEAVATAIALSDSTCA